MAHPEEAATLRSLLDELGPSLPGTPAVTRHATASGHARVHRAGRDRHIGRS
ncbi:hypothetical protein [Streptomyces sp. NPDC047974]|uniref:hypothetical protein n=1 Tax=Streptomyces sp. NPDC047974 TaxID=3154343 RepID=UPI00340EACAC